MSSLDTERSLTSVRISDLISAVEGQQTAIAPERALNTLLHKRMTGKSELLQGILATSNDEALRLVALRGLGMLSQIESRKSLTDNLAALPLVEARVAVSSLGRIGGPSELDALTVYRTNANTSLLPRIDASRRLIAFRHGLDTMRIKTPEADLIRQPRVDEGRRMLIGAVNATTLKGFSRRIREEVPGIELSLDRAVDAVCLKKRIWFMHNRKSTSATGIGNLQKKPQIPMVIMGYADCSDRPYLFAYILSQPADDGVEFFVARLNGAISHFGNGTISGDEVKFVITAIKSRFAPAARIAGKFSGADGILDLEEALTLEDTSEQATLARRPQMIDSLTFSQAERH